VKVNKWQVDLPRLLLKFRLNQAKSDQIEAGVFAGRNVGSVKYEIEKDHPAPTVCTVKKLLHL
jgi:hypothetical protein